MFLPNRFQIGAALLIASLGTFARAADTAAAPLVLTVFTDVAGGTALLQGRHDAAIAQLQEVSRTVTDSPRLTNLCVAHITARDWADARPTCDAAINAALDDRALAPTSPAWVRDQYKNRVAMAYSNRAVLKLLSDEQAAGEADLGLARKAAPRAPFVMRNLASRQHVRGAQVIIRSAPIG